MINFRNFTIITVSLLAINFIIFNSTYAQNTSNCFEKFYETKDHNCVIQILNHENITNKNTGFNPGLIGFLSVYFAEFPDKKQTILNMDFNQKTQIGILQALRIARLNEDLKNYLLKAPINPNFFKSLMALNDLNTISLYDPAHNDKLIGAFMESGNSKYILNILKNIETVPDQMAKDAIRTSFFSKFGPNLQPNGRHINIIKTVCERNGCSKDKPDNLLRILTISTGFWALKSLSDQHPIIKTTFNQFLENNKKISSFYQEEAIGFANYLTKLSLYSVINDNVNINKSLEIYENFGSMEDEQKAMMSK